MSKVKERLKHRFKMTDQRSAQFVLGVEIKRRLGGGYFLVQEKFVSKVVIKFGISGLHSIRAGEQFWDGGGAGVRGDGSNDG